MALLAQHACFNPSRRPLDRTSLITFLRKGKKRELSLRSLTSLQLHLHALPFPRCELSNENNNYRILNELRFKNYRCNCIVVIVRIIFIPLLVLLFSVTRFHLFQSFNYSIKQAG